MVQTIYQEKEKLKELGENARKEVINNYTWKKNVENLLIKLIL